MISEMQCIVCGRPAVVVMSTRIDAGSVHYVSCETHITALAGRLGADAARAAANLDARHVAAIDVEVT